MLSRRFAQQGVTLIELVVSLTILGLLFGLGVPSFRGWIQNAQIRTAAEAIQNGLQLARVEAVRRNITVRFQLTNTATNACALSATGANWVVSLNNAAGKCANAAADPPLPPAIPDPANPYIIQARSAAEGSPNVAVSTDPATTTIIFNGLGRLTPVPAGNINITVSSPSSGTCVQPGETAGIRCLRVVVSMDGQVRMCDPAVTLATDLRVCP